MIEIKHSYTKKVIRKVDVDSLQHADLQHADLQHADLQHANLVRANLVRADLRGANLQHADLRSVDLRYANLQHANLRYCIGNSREIKTLLALKWIVSWTATDLAIGCQQHSIEEWENFSDDEINKMDNEALVFWKAHKALIFQLIKAC